MAEAVVVGPVALGALLLLEPQPATSSGAAKTRTRARLAIDLNGRHVCLNGA
jgi:hypothetical protein